jgi:hypothetical protein
MTVEKLNDTTLRVTKTMPVSTDYDYNYLVEQRARIVAQKERDNTQRDLEIAEVDALLAEFTKLKMDTTIKEVVEEVI